MWHIFAFTRYLTDPEGTAGRRRKRRQKDSLPLPPQAAKAQTPPVASRRALDQDKINRSAWGGQWILVHDGPGVIDCHWESAKEC
jgi:predicted amidohydrolase